MDQFRRRRGPRFESSLRHYALYAWTSVGIHKTRSGSFFVWRAWQLGAAYRDKFALLDRRRRGCRPCKSKQPRRRRGWIGFVAQTQFHRCHRQTSVPYEFVSFQRSKSVSSNSRASATRNTKPPALVPERLATINDVTGPSGLCRFARGAFSGLGLLAAVDAFAR